jgi:putative acetyltransferase
VLEAESWLYAKPLIPKFERMNITLRHATANDAPGILATHVAALRELCAGEYSETQLRAWSSGLAPEGYLPAIDSHVFLVAEGDTGIVGFVDFDPSGGEIVAMYVHPRHARLGLGTMLLQAIEARARAADIRELVLTSSITAVPFYERFGFVAGPSTTHQLADGSGIPAVSMRREF